MDKKNLIKNLVEFKKRIAKKYLISKIILFGSRATNKFKENSDIDLMLVGEFKGKNGLERCPKLYLEWHIDLPVDFLCYTPKEFNKLKNQITIVKEANEKGIVI